MFWMDTRKILSWELALTTPPLLKFSQGFLLGQEGGWEVPSQPGAVSTPSPGLQTLAFFLQR